MGQLLTSEIKTEAVPFIPVLYFCSSCGWAIRDIDSTCRRCEDPNQKKTSMRRPIFGKNTGISGNGTPTGYPPEELGIERFDNSGYLPEPDGLEKKSSFNNTIGNESTIKHKKFNKKLKNLNRRSRAYSRQFVMHVMTRNEISVPATVREDDFQADPIVNKIVQLAQRYRREKSELVLEDLEKILHNERLKGTTWQDIADKTIVELIINEIDALHFVAVLMNVYGISYYDFGRFLSTPPDEGTMSLIEEAVCQDLLDLFYDVLKMDRQVLRGVLNCNDVSLEVRDVLLSIIEQIT